MTTVNALGLLRRLGPADARNIVRDPLLLSGLVLPPAIAWLLRLGVPALGEWLQRRFAFDLAPYYPLVAGSYVVVAPSIVGFIGGFLLLDERDDHVIDALRVTPVSMTALLTYRLGVPLIAGTLMTVAGYAMIGLVPVPAWSLIVSAAVAAGIGPILALFLSVFADNKVSGFAMAKLFTAVSNIALVAWFIPMPWQLLAGIAPSYWPMKVIWQTAAGSSWYAYAVSGLVVNAVVTTLLVRRLNHALST